MTRLWIIGAGGHAKVVVDAARLTLGDAIAGVLDDRAALWGTQFRGLSVRGPISPQTLEELSVNEAIIAIGDNSAREVVAQRLAGSVQWVAVAHPGAIIAASADVGAGSFIAAGAVVQADAWVGEHVIVNTASSVDHDCIIENFAHIAPGATIAGSVRIGNGVLIGAGATIIPGKRVGALSTIGAGSVVTRDVPAESVALGVPAKVMRAPSR